MRRQIVVAGNLSLDDTITPAASIAGAPGGDALYAAVGARLWGAEVSILSLVGEDYPAEHLDRIRQMGISTDLVRRVSGPTLHYRVTYRTDGSRTFDYVSAPHRLDATSPVARDYGRIAGAAWLHIAAMPIRAQQVAVAAGRKFGIPLSLDPHEENVVGFEIELARLVAATMFLPSELEARLLFPDLDGLDPVPFAIAAADRLAAWRPSLLVVKLGRLGSVVRDGDVTVHMPAPSVAIVDPTGAGDAYCGAFVQGWLATRSATLAAVCGSLAAAFVMSRFGAFADDGWPSLEELLIKAGALLKKSAEAEANPLVDTLRRAFDVQRH